MPFVFFKTGDLKWELLCKSYMTVSSGSAKALLSRSVGERPGPTTLGSGIRWPWYRYRELFKWCCVLVGSENVSPGSFGSPHAMAVSLQIIEQQIITLQIKLNFAYGLKFSALLGITAPSKRCPSVVTFLLIVGSSADGTSYVGLCRLTLTNFAKLDCFWH